MAAVQEVVCGLGRTPDARKLGDPVRLDRKLEAGLHDGRADRIVAATGAERGDRALVIPAREADVVLRQRRVMQLRLGEIGHEAALSR